MHMDSEAYRAIEREIASETSPVGIDAKKTHVLILQLHCPLEELPTFGPNLTQSASRARGFRRNAHTLPQWPTQHCCRQKGILNANHQLLP